MESLSKPTWFPAAGREALGAIKNADGGMRSRDGDDEIVVLLFEEPLDPSDWMVESWNGQIVGDFEGLLHNNVCLQKICCCACC